MLKLFFFLQYGVSLQKFRRLPIQAIKRNTQLLEYLNGETAIVTAAKQIQKKGRSKLTPG